MLLFAMCLGVFIAQLDSQVVNLALRQIGISLGTNVSALQWVMDSYNLCYATLLLTGGTLGDLFGRVRIFVIGLALIVAGSILCAVAPDTLTLIAGRALTGVGAALTVPTSLAILTVAYPDPKARTHAIGIWASCNGIAIAVGPTVGGLLVDAAGWRSIFALSVPLCALAMVIAYWYVPESRDAKDRHLDPLGQFFAIVSLAALAFLTIEGPHGTWVSPMNVILALLFVASGIAFVMVERNKPGAMVPLDLFRISQFNAALAGAITMTFGMYAMLFLTPIYLQQQGGMSAFQVGLFLLPMSIAFIIVSQMSGWLDKLLGTRILMTAGLGCMGLGLLLLTRISVKPDLILIGSALLIIGIGLGLNTAPVNAVAVASVARQRAGTASGLVNTSRMIGATLGIAILGAIFAVHAAAGSPQDAVTGLRLAYFGGACAEFAGALIAVTFIRADAARQTQARA